MVVVVVVATDFGRVTWKKKHFPRTKGRGRLNTGTEKPLAFMNVTLIHPQEVSHGAVTLLDSRTQLNSEVPVADPAASPRL